MKGKRSFTPIEAQRIRSILLEQPRTKETRDKLRAIDFYISDFHLPPPFSVDDFDRLVASDEIIIGSGSALPPDERRRRAIASPSDTRRVEAVRLLYLPERIRYLLVGESVPNGGTFFYDANSILFRYTYEAFRQVFERDCGEEQAFLRFFQKQGFFLDDLCSIPVNALPDCEREQERSKGVDSLAERL